VFIAVQGDVMLLRLSSLICGCLFLTVGCQPSVPPPAGSDDSNDELKVSDSGSEDGSDDSADDWKPEFARMESELELSDAESNALQAAFEAREADVSAWMTQKGVRLRTLESTMKSAARSKDLGGVRKAIAEAKPLREELRSVINEAQEAITTALTDANQTAWKAVLLRDRLLELMEPLQLSDEQEQLIHAEARNVVQSSVAEVNPEAAGFIKLEKAVESSILTPAQRVDYEPIKKKNALRLFK
jgi:hypothetical protein